MCGRFSIGVPGDVIRAEFGLEALPADYEPRYNVAPTQPVLALIEDAAGRRAGWLRWGLVPPWADDPASGSRMINARAETVDRKPAFRAAFRDRRCLVVADGFYEWRKEGEGKVPHWISLPDGRLFAFAGLWERWRPDRATKTLYTCTILTRDAAPGIAHIHPRMPVILPAGARDRWLEAGADPAELKALALEGEPPPLAARTVSRRVNSVRNDDPACRETADPLE